ncbi:MAG: PAS domain-containing protein [Hyphomicrobiaceae bacterium]|nr:PAS domain-containing protein [Hyphomicrobiaceae bacterium]
MTIGSPRLTQVGTLPFAAGVSTATCVLNLEGDVIWVSEAEHPLFAGRNVVGTSFQSLWATASQPSIAMGTALALQQGASQISGVDPYGNAVNASIELRRDAQQQPLEFIVTVTQPRAGTLRLSEQVATLFEALPLVAMVSEDPEAGMIIGNSEAARRYKVPLQVNHSFNRTNPEAGKSYRLLRNGRDVPAHELPLQRAGKGEEVRDEEYEARLVDGTVRHIILNAAPLRGQNGEILGSVVVETEITQRKRLEVAQASLLQCSRVPGPAFFAALVKAISETLGARQVYVAEITEEDPRVLRTLAAYIDGKPGTYGDFIPHATPCADVVQGNTLFIASGVGELYPHSAVLKHNRVDSYIGTPLRAANGTVIGIIGVLHDSPMDESLRPVDIVEIFAGRAAAEIQRMRSEATLRESEQKYRVITDVIPSLVAFVDTEERYQFANAAYDRWFGLDPESLEGRALKDILAPEAYEVVSPYLKRALRGERISYESCVPTPNGEPKHLKAEYVPHYEGGQLRGVFTFVSDISELKRHEEALSKSEQQFRTLFEHLPVGAALTNRDGAILLENDVFASLLPSKDVATPAGRNIFDRSCTAHTSEGMILPAAMHPLRQALRGFVARDVELLCHHAEGSDRWVRMSATPIFGDEDHVTGALVVVADIHGEKRDMARRTLLINELNHRVKNTLASVQSIASQTFRASAVTKDNLEAFEERLLALSNAHNLLTNELWEGADLKQLVAIVLEPHDPGAGRLVTSGPSVRLKPAAALAFAMALHELATNAVKYGAFSVPGGNVHLTWQLEPVPEGRRLRVKWMERGGPPVATPERKGFGTRLIERSLAFELGSETTVQYDPLGVTCEIDADFREISS